MSQQVAKAILVLLGVLCVAGCQGDAVEQASPAGPPGQQAEAEKQPAGAEGRDAPAARMKEEAAVSDPHLTEVEVTGVGLSPDKAEQHAYTRAVEQAVGVLVDSETLIENDEIVREKVLTYSKGIIENHEVVRQWAEEGFYYLHIRAWVKVGEIVQRLEEGNVAVIPVSGRRERLKILHGLKAEESIAEMIRSVMRDCTMDKLLTISIVDKPEVVEKDRVQAKLQIVFTLSSKMENWWYLQRRLKPLFETAAEEKLLLSSEPQFEPHRQGGVKGSFFKLIRPNDYAEKTTGIWNRLSRQEYFGFYLLRDMKEDVSQTFWDVYFIAKPLIAASHADLKDRHYNLAIELVDARGNGVKRISRPLGGIFTELKPRRRNFDYWTYFMWNKDQMSFFILAPLFYVETYGDHGLRDSLTFEETVSVDLDQLKDVSNCRLWIEEAPDD